MHTNYSRPLSQHFGRRVRRVSGAGCAGTAEADIGTAEWTHALAEKSEADPARFRTGDDLRVALENALREAAAQPIPASAVSGD